MPTYELELTKINRNIIRLAEFLLTIKKEDVELPEYLNYDFKFFINYQYGIDIDQINITKTLEIYQKHLQTVQRKMKNIKVSQALELNLRILKSIVKETDLLISAFTMEGFEFLKV